jgi:hypothetical protein
MYEVGKGPLAQVQCGANLLLPRLASREVPEGSVYGPKAPVTRVRREETKKAPDSKCLELGSARSEERNSNEETDDKGKR